MVSRRLSESKEEWRGPVDLGRLIRWDWWHCERVTVWVGREVYWGEVLVMMAQRVVSKWV